MRLISFSTKDWLLSLLLFLGGCYFQPPDPVEISTPGSVSRTTVVPEENEIFLTLTLDKDQKIYYHTASREKTQTAKLIRDADVDKIASVVREIGQQSKNKMKQLVVFLVADPSASPQAVNLMAEALRNNQIFKFNLITRPE